MRSIKYVFMICLLVTIVFATNLIEAWAAGNLRIRTSPDSASLDAGGAGTTVKVNSGLDLGSFTINMASASSQAFTDFIRIDNTKTPKVGWHVNVSATNFVATVTDYSSANANATLTVRIPPETILTVIPQTPTAINSSDLSNVTAQNTSGIAVTTSGVSILSAASTFGFGIYK